MKELKQADQRVLAESLRDTLKASCHGKSTAGGAARHRNLDGMMGHESVTPIVLAGVVMYAVLGFGRALPQVPPPIAGAVQAAQLDINTATESQLKELPGVGDAYSKKIIAGRPYRRKDELVQKKIMPQATYDQVKDQIVAKPK